MKIAKQITTVIVLIVLATPLFAADDDTKAFGQFQGFLEGMDQKSFEMMQDYIDQTDLTNRILSHQSVQPDVEQTFRSDFWNIIETGVASVLPPEGSKVKGELIQFEFDDGQGRACVRFAYPNQTGRAGPAFDSLTQITISSFTGLNCGTTDAAV